MSQPFHPGGPPYLQEQTPYPYTSQYGQAPTVANPTAVPVTGSVSDAVYVSQYAPANGSGYQPIPVSACAPYPPSMNYSPQQPSPLYHPPIAQGAALSWGYYPPAPPSPYHPPPPPATSPHQNSSTPAYNVPSPVPNYLTPLHYHASPSPSQSHSQYSPPSPYLTPPYSAPAPYPANQSYGTPQYGAPGIMHNPGVPASHPTSSAGLQHSTIARKSTSPSLDLTKLSLNAKSMAAQHWITCDGCGAHPLKGDRWRCLSCTTYDLCQTCREEDIHSHHRFELIPCESETHNDACCNGCSGEDKDRLLVGPRYKCLTHQDEDWCQRCKDAGKACAGPFEVIRQTELGMQLEWDRCLPMPDEWLPYVKPAVATYSSGDRGATAMWYDSIPVLEWFDAPLRRRSSDPTPVKFKTVLDWKKGKLGRNGKVIHDIFEVGANGAEKKIYTFLARIDMKTESSTGETFTAYKGGSTSPVFSNDATSNTLSFEDPVTRIRYRWVSNRRMSTLNHERYDFQRNALLQHHYDGTKTMIADWTWHDGHSLTEPCLTIRDPNISHGLVIASLTVLHDHHWTVMQEDFEKDPDSVNETQATARLTPLGMYSYWHATDDGGEAIADAVGKPGMTKEQKWALANSVLKGANVGLKIAAAVVGAGGQ